MTLRRDPNELGDFPCTKCGSSFLALFLLIEHLRKDHGDKLAPLMRQA